MLQFIFELKPQGIKTFSDFNNGGYTGFLKVLYFGFIRTDAEKPEEHVVELFYNRIYNFLIHIAKRPLKSFSNFFEYM